MLAFIYNQETHGTSINSAGLITPTAHLLEIKVIEFERNSTTKRILEAKLRKVV